MAWARRSNFQSCGRMHSRVNGALTERHRLNPKIAGSGEDILERDLVAQGLEAADGTVRDSSTVEFVEMVGTEVLVNGAVLDQVVNGDEHAMGDSDRGPTLTTPRRQAVVLSREVAVTDPRGAPSGFDHSAAQPAGTQTGTSGASLAGRLIVTWAELGPRGEVGGAGKATHVGADLDQDLLGIALTDAGNGVEASEQSFKRAQALLDLLVEIGDLAVQELQLVELFAK